MEMMRLSVVLGGAALIVAGVGGMALGLGYEPFFADGFYKVDLARALVKAGHTHGMSFALINLIAALLIPRLGLSAKLKRICSWLAAGALIMPVGLVLRGLDDGGRAFMPLGILGALCLMACAALIIAGGLRWAKG